MLTIKRYVRAQSLDEAYALCQKRANVVLGGMLWLKTQNRTVDTAIDLCGLGLDTIEETPDAYRIGAMVSLRALEQHAGLGALTQGALAESVRHIVGVQFRNCATLGGSIAARFGFSDLLCALLALDCEVELFKAGRMPLEQYAKMPADRDILVRIHVKKNGRRPVYQTMRNAETDLPVLAVAASEKDGQVRVVVGARPARAEVVNAPLALAADKAALEAFQAAMQSQLTFAGNMRGSEEYRRHLANVLTGRCLAALQEG